ncbi:MAG: Ntn hydrolase family protein, partial [Planctomycetota bacterium]
VSGSGDVIEPDDGVLGIGSGGGYATAAARALLAHADLGAEEIVREALVITADLCIHTNREIWVETLS